jgi:hypothetical protein
MTRSGWQRWAPLSGIAFVVFMVVGFGFGGSTPDVSKDSAKTFVALWSSSANRAHLLIGGYLTILAAIAFLGFAAGLWERVRGAGGDGMWLMLTAGLFAGFLGLGGFLFALDAGNITFGNLPVPDGELLRWSSQLPYGIILILGGFSAAGFLVAASLLGAKQALLPGWLTVAGLVAAVLMLGAPLFFPFLALPLWVLLASITLLVRDRRTGAGERPPIAAAAT